MEAEDDDLGMAVASDDDWTSPILMSSGAASKTEADSSLKSRVRRPAAAG
jgi:hypothetical protein